MKILTKVRLINWHRFENETLEFSRSVLLSGENGAGKSTVLDAIQFVVTCSKANFNKAAHEKGKRTLNSYIRCKTGREQRPYERQGSLSAHIALEFFDEERDKPFVIGAVMDSLTEEKEPNVAWYLMDNRQLEDELFFQGRQVKSISVFRSTNRGIRQFAQTATEARKMILTRFGRLENKFFSLIPKALAFRPIHDIKDFVYSYVLDEKEVNIEALRENVQSFQELERMLKDVRIRIEELETILARKAEVDNYLRIDCRQEYFLARIACDLLQQEIEDAKAGRRRAQGDRTRLRHEKEKLSRIRDSKEQSILRLQMELAGDREFQALQELQKQKKDLQTQLSSDRMSVEELNGYALRAADRADALRQALGGEHAFAGTLQDYSTALRGLTALPDLTGLRIGMQEVKEFKQQTFREVSGALARLRIRISEQESALTEIAGRIRMLENKQLVYRPEVQLLQEKIRAQLKSLGRSGEASILCEQLEIRDEAWRNAVEGYLNTQRFYLLVDPEDFDMAAGVYDQLRRRKKAYGVGLINTGRLGEYEEAPEGSLAQYVSSKDPRARRYANMVLGKVHCCESVEQLKRYPVSITKQCMKYQNHVVSAISPKIFSQPYIGSGAYRVQLEQARGEKQKMDEALADLRQQAAQQEAMLEPLSGNEDIEVSFRLKELELLREHQTQLDTCEKELAQLQGSRTMMQKQLHLQALENEKAKLQQDLEETLLALGQAQERISSCEQSIEDVTAQLNAQQEETAAVRGRLAEEGPDCDREYEKQTAGKEYEKYRQNYEGARKGNRTRREKTEHVMMEAMRAYRIAHDFGAPDTMEGFPEFQAEYDKLKHSQLLEYQDKVQRAKDAAEAEFREQFLARLQENIRQAQQEFRDLNRGLADIRFANERYEFRYEPRRNLKQFYDMIMDDFNVLEGESLFTSRFNEAHRQAIDELFARLAMDDENSAKALEEYTDYRTYMDYDIRITFDDGSCMFYSKVSREKSGGETQTPFYITIAASFMQLYRASIGTDAIGLVMMDEAFNNMDDSRMKGVLSFMNHSNLQTIIAAPPEKIQYIAPEVDSVLLVLTDGQLSYVEDFTHEKI
ncbi:MAG: AAA family ATPase [Firmicutes bacterium]|nr:AAA family ATPase [Bacillota bacterium]